MNIITAGKSILMVSSLAMLASCSTAGQYSRTKEKFKEATGQSLTSWSARKKKFIEKSDSRIKDIALDLTEMKNESIKLPASKKKDALSSIDESRDLIDDAREELGQLRNASAKNWQGSKQEFLSKMDILDSSFEKTRSFF